MKCSMCTWLVRRVLVPMVDMRRLYTSLQNTIKIKGISNIMLLAKLMAMDAWMKTNMRA